MLGHRRTVKAHHDIPQRIARLMFFIGILWALFLVVPLVAMTSMIFLAGPKPLPMMLHIFCGYAVWMGWFWRSRRLRSLFSSSLLWSCSFIVNATFIIHAFPTGPQWQRVFYDDPMALMFFWWLIASLLSLVALAYEFKLSRKETRAA